MLVGHSAMAICRNAILLGKLSGTLSILESPRLKAPLLHLDI